jgi:tRNA(fMet)-specific endonuclease VapC
LEAEKMMRCIWDSDVVSEFLKGRNALIAQKAAAYLTRYGQIEISLFTRYEVLRGLRAKKAKRLLRKFESFCSLHVVHLLPEDIIDIAADIWAELSRKGQPIGDSDPIIAATALHHGLGIATRNVAHFSRIPGLTVEDWSQP